MTSFDTFSLGRTFRAPSVAPAPQSVVTTLNPITATLGDTTIRAIAPAGASG